MSSPIQPTGAKFFVSDDLREEANGKITIVGLFVDDRIFVLPLPASAPALPQGYVAALNQLCLTCILVGGQGSYSVKTAITTPSGKKFVEQKIDQTFDPNKTATIGIRGNNILFPEFGKYKVDFTVGRKVYDYKFELLQGPAPNVGTVLPKPAAPATTTVSTNKQRTTLKRKGKP